MKRGMLADYFTGVAAKRLSAVETNPTTSNQHELNGTSALREILGQPPGTTRFPCKMVYLSDSDSEPVMDEAHLTWYDARANDPKRTEWRLYYPDTTVTGLANASDILVLARLHDDSLLLLIAESDSTIANQVLWLFGIEDVQHPGFSVRVEPELEQDRLEFARSLILESLGIEVETGEDMALEQMLTRFGATFPPTREFSSFSRSLVGEIDILGDPDGSLMAWMSKEEALFRTFEKHLLADRLQEGFANDVDGFLSYSLTVQNRRKARVGFAFENHLEAVFTAMHLDFSRGAKTENKARPDFLFPGITAYRDETFPSGYLTMLGAKSTCKDRWRQVLSEAERVPNKHLITLEAAISTNQTNEMQANLLQLVVPSSIHASFTHDQQYWLMTLQMFCELVSERQKLVR